MKVFLLFLTFLLSHSVLFSQFDLDNFEGLKSSGLIPEAFIQNSSQKYKEARLNVNNSNVDDEFLIETNFFLDGLLLSGKVTFNDPISLYTKDLAGKLLENDPVLFDSLQFYTLKSNIPNAFSTDQGIIIVTSGLVARCKNENMLAFVLAHEIAHFTEKHVRKTHIKSRELSDHKIHSQFDYNLIVNEISKYSKTNELEADRLGKDLYLKAGFPEENIKQTLEMLRDAAHTIFDQPFDSDILELPCFLRTIPDSIFSNYTQAPIKEEDESTTHPNIKDRISALNLDSTDQHTQTAINRRFEDVRELALFETINIYNQQGEFYKSLHLNSHLIKKRPNNKFLEFAKVHALYGIAIKKTYHIDIQGLEAENHENSAALPVQQFFSQIKTSSLLHIAYAHALAANQNNPDILGDVPYEQKLKYEIADHYTSTEKDIHLFFDTHADSIDWTDNANLLSQSIRIVSDTNKFLTDLAKTTRFTKYTTEDEKYTRHSYERTEDKTQPEGAIFLDPMYERLGLEKKGKYYLKSEKDKIEFSERLSDMVVQFDSTSQVLDPISIKYGEVEKFNDFALLSAWLNNRAWVNSTDLINSQQRFLNSSEHLGTSSHVVLSGISAYKVRRKLGDNPWDHYYLAPYFLINSMIIRNKFEMYLLSVNLKNGNIETTLYKNVKFKGSPTTLDFHTYRFLETLYE